MLLPVAELWVVQIERGKLMGNAIGRNAIGQQKDDWKQCIASSLSKKPTYVFCDGSFSIFSFACASQFYDAFFFYHTA